MSDEKKVHSRATTTVVFADLTGSTRAFEALGNARATETITEITQWIGRVCEAHGGQAIKKLGDGVLAVFPEGLSAVAAAQELQRQHTKRLQSWPTNLRMELQIGLASGDVVEVDGDSYGDTVNVAARLSDLAGPRQIWVTGPVISQLDGALARYRNLGPISIRGRIDVPVIYRIDWQEDAADQLTQPAPLSMLSVQSEADFGQIELTWLNVNSIFTPSQFPVQLGRSRDADFVIDDPRVSRVHALLELRNGRCVLVDVSTYGTWVRFHSGVPGANSETIALRRDECVLHGSGDIGLGAPLTDFTAPSIGFRTSAEQFQAVCR